MNVDCCATIAPREEYGSNQHQIFRCLKGVTKTEKQVNEDVNMDDA